MLFSRTRHEAFKTLRLPTSCCTSETQRKGAKRQRSTWRALNSPMTLPQKNYDGKGSMSLLLLGTPFASGWASTDQQRMRAEEANGLVTTRTLCLCDNTTCQLFDPMQSWSKRPKQSINLLINQLNDSYSYNHIKLTTLHEK